MSRPMITVVGGGVVGTQVALRLLQSGSCKVRLVDGGDALSKDPGSRPNSQVPWGWHRRYSLQPKVKTGLGHVSHDIPFDDINMTRGPMLVTTKRQSVTTAWKSWMERNPESDADVISPRDAATQFGLAESYFASPTTLSSSSDTVGGVFVCDSRDCLIDYSALIARIWEYLDDHEDCEIIKNAPVEQLSYENGKAVALCINGEKVAIDETLFCIGNQSSTVLPNHPPIINITLPYAFITPTQKFDFVGLWNEESTLSCFQDGSVKLASGLLSMLSIKRTILDAPKIIPHLPAFAKIMINGIQGLHVGWDFPEDELYRLGFAELESLGLMDPNHQPDLMNKTSCTIDMSPSMCPYVDRLPYASNVLLATAMSGSGSLGLDPWFSGAVADVLLSASLNQQPQRKSNQLLSPFRVPTSLPEYWNPHPDMGSPISTMGSTD